MPSAPGQVRLAAVGAGQDHSHGDQALQSHLTGLVHDTHAPAAQLPKDLVTGYPGTQLRGGGRDLLRRGARSPLLNPQPALGSAVMPQTGQTIRPPGMEAR